MILFFKDPLTVLFLSIKQKHDSQNSLVNFVDLSCFCSVSCLLCLCVRLFICALGSPAGKGLTSWLSLVVSTMSL